MLSTLHKIQTIIFPKYVLEIELNICDSVYRMFVTYGDEPERTFDKFIEIIDASPGKFEEVGIRSLSEIQDYNVYTTICDEYMKLLFNSLAASVYERIVHNDEFTLKELLDLKQFIARVFSSSFV